MAESIVRAWRPRGRHAATRPLAVHYNGTFHSTRAQPPRRASCVNCRRTHGGGVSGARQASTSHADEHKGKGDT
jgi:glucan biosynthesis protein